jgi:hypothetical protein
MTAGILHDKIKRTEKANQVLEIVSSHGRKFFLHNGVASHLEVDPRGRIWFVDSYTLKRIYTPLTGHWQGFSEGGGLRRLVMALCNYITTGEMVPWEHFGPWPPELCNGDTWGYGEAMVTVRAQVQSLGILAQKPGGIQ